MQSDWAVLSRDRSPVPRLIYRHNVAQCVPSAAPRRWSIGRLVESTTSLVACDYLDALAALGSTISIIS
jgi:hypothetical protein